MTTLPISDPTIKIIPSKEMIKFIKSFGRGENMPDGITAVLTNKQRCLDTIKPTDHDLLMTEDDFKYINSLELEHDDNTGLKKDSFQTSTDKDENIKHFLVIEDLIWLYKESKNTGGKVHLHELLQECSIVLPKNDHRERSIELEARCEKLRAQQDARDYAKMTRNCENFRARKPEDSIAFQMKQINRQLIAVLQFVISVLAGFAFGFIGVELITGSLDFGFRLLLGVMCALTVALAEIYFLAKQLSIDDFLIDNKGTLPPNSPKKLHAD